uniref:Biogenesis of lysosome-related organelles complex 1 subunit 2 n=1 Tax=Strongyloides papillosus TaxID=174720 RepID=A0A0N5C8B1_STREA
MEELKTSFNSMITDLASKFQNLSNVDPNDEAEQMANQFLECYVKEEEGANLLEKYQQYLILLKKLNIDNCRASNQCSTRLGNMKQILTENTDTYNNLAEQLKKLPDMVKQLNSIGNRIDVLHKYIIQSELALHQLSYFKGETTL